MWNVFGAQKKEAGLERNEGE